MWLHYAIRRRHQATGEVTFVCFDHDGFYFSAPDCLINTWNYYEQAAEAQRHYRIWSYDEYDINIEYLGLDRCEGLLSPDFVFSPVLLS